MSIDRSKISQQQIDKIFLIEEDHFHDFKAVDIKPSKLTKSISAFANADGGELFIGIKEDKQTRSKAWVGFANIEDANGHLQAFESVLTLGSYHRYSFLHADGYSGYVLHAEVFKTRDIVKTTDGLIYQRKGAQSLPIVTTDQIRRLELNKGIASFETETVKAEIADLANSTAMIKFALEIIPATEPETWLKKQKLIFNNLPTVGGSVLFSDEPQALIPKHCGIKIYRYRTSDEEGHRESLMGIPQTVEGCLYDQIYKSVMITKEIIESIRKMTTDGFDDVEYPEETLHEIITNAVIHRDYSIPDDIHIRIFDNRVEVENPGVLPGHITPDNILNERFARNGMIVRIINKFPNPPNKDVGEGLNTAFRAMQMLKLKSPIIQVKEHSVLVTIKHERLASPQELIMEYLTKNETIDNGEARDLCVIRQDWRIRKIFKDMIEAGMIEKTEGSVTGNTKYKKCARGKELT